MRRLGTYAASAYLIAAYVFIFLPVLVLVLFSFQDGLLPVPPFKGPSLRWYAEVFANRRLMDALGNSVVVALVSSLIATVLGFLAAYGLARRRGRFAGLVQYALVAPLTVSYLIIGLGLLVTFNLFGMPKSLLAVGIGHVVINLPLTFAILYSQLGDHQARVERAARDLGAGDLATVALITVPMMWTGLLAAFCLTATFSWDEFIIAFLLSRFEVTLPVSIWGMLRSGLDPALNAAGTLVFAISFVLVIGVELGLMRAARKRR